MRKFFQEVLNSESTASSRRLVTLIISGHFILTSFMVTFYALVRESKAAVNERVIGLLEKILEYDFYIILVGLCFITADGFISIFIEKLRAKVAIAAPVPAPAKPDEPTQQKKDQNSADLAEDKT